MCVQSLMGLPMWRQECNTLGPGLAGGLRRVLRLASAWQGSLDSLTCLILALHRVLLSV